ncbi:type I-C CRISPR-associated protein Cas8c/Csd1 [Psychrobacter aestuarii]|uniref:Type I-C CRISPR-associated protein Cas8c/Csd1 n=1 Tax=Psychrobacter aestuarii TaxID=556327 RepID=A0ABP3FBL2_9GAMM|nr:type I-C CRISPR-associated protein Cas8c/Csd1 [Psychrobacter aestuarii]
MSWLQRLYQTYEAASQNADIQAQDQKLMPYYHVNQNVQIIVTINDKGDFVRAEVCRDGNGKVKSKYLAIPATNDSATRSGQIPPPHPLSDKVQYVAGDYFEGYAVNPKRDFHQPYLELLSSWCESQYVHSKAQAVLTYVKKGTLVKDLIDAHVLIVDPDDKSKLAYPEQASDYPDSILSALNKNKGVFDQGAAFIAWNVIASSLDTPTQHVTETWRDDSLFAAWQQFYATLDSTDGFCYITGGTSPLASKHPNRILRSATNAKLISANDATGYTFRGRFTDTTGMQAAGISAVVTEKAHAALSWLLSRQGREEAGQAIVAWSISGIEVPQPTSVAAPLNVLDAAKTSGNDDDDDDDNFEEYEDEAAGTEPTFQHSNDLGYRFATHLRNTLQGYRQQLPEHQQISIITLEAATPGRMAMTYYHESMPSQYIDALQTWYTQFAWYHTYRDDDSNQQRLGIQSPTPKQIAQVAYGARLSDALKKQVVAQVLPCIVEGEARCLPRQLVELCIKRACNPLALERWEWEQALSTACALYRGYYLRQSDNKKRSYTVALQPELTSRDYLYGRLLAVAEDIESLALYVAGEKRNTTAQRYMQQFANRPFTTWRNIELALKPYENRLKSNRGGYLAKKQQLIDEIMSAFTSDRFTDDSALSGEFLLGYHSQKMQFKLDKEHAKAEVENDSDAA